MATASSANQAVIKLHHGYCLVPVSRNVEPDPEFRNETIPSCTGQCKFPPLSAVKVACGGHFCVVVVAS